MGVLKEPVVFVDIETTGKSYGWGRVIEVAAIKLDPTGEVCKYQTLINPGESLHPGITALTGITNQSLGLAPKFREVAEELFNFLEGCVFVAHHVRFDYSFLKAEFGKVGLMFRPKMLCTVRISRRLFPDQRKHNLDAIISRLGIAVPDRHRAMADAEVLWQFYRHIHQQFDVETLDQTFKSQFRLQALPANLSNELIDSLPSTPGAYVFEGEDSTPLYIGKANNIRDRVLSHFNSDHRHTKELKLAQQVKNITFVETHGELSALLLESAMIKKHQPLYNHKLRRLEEMAAIVKGVDENGYFKAAISKNQPDNLTDILGVYKTAGAAKRALETLGRQFYLCPKLLGLERAKKECFSHQLKRCLGACCTQESVMLYNARFEAAFAKQRVEIWPFKGPIVVSEIHPLVEGASGFVFDNWCLMGQLKDCEGQVEFTALNQVFDKDMYAILKRHLSNPVNRSRIRNFHPSPEFAH